MKKWLFTKANVIRKEDKLLWAYNMFEIPVNVDEVWLKMTVQLNKETIDDSADLWYSELTGVADEYIKKMKPSIFLNWEMVELNTEAFVALINDCATEAMRRGSEWDKDLFKVRVERPNDKLNAFKRENKDALKEYERLEKRMKVQPEQTDKTEAMFQEILNRLDRPTNQPMANQPLTITSPIESEEETPKRVARKTKVTINKWMTDEDILDLMWVWTI